MSLNNEQSKIRLFLIYLNLVELKYYPYMITLDQCNGACSTLIEIFYQDLCPKQNIKYKQDKTYTIQR